ncbi:hypothetical protein AB669_19490 [Pedobacter sp. BMA]|nr:hypothetical protein AB669_19490 [Pedobacter sp. BMA]
MLSAQQNNADEPDFGQSNSIVISEGTLDALKQALVDRGYSDHFYDAYQRAIENMMDYPQPISLQRGQALESQTRNLIDCIVQLGTKPHEFEIRNYLISINFNHPFIYQLICDFIKSETYSETSRVDQLYLLYSFRRDIQQHQANDNKAFFPSMEDLFSVILRWIEAEVQHINDTTGIIEGDFNSLDFGAFKTILTVQQLAVLAKLLIDMKIITPESPRAVHLFIVKNFRTSDGKKISEHSVHNRFYEVFDNVFESLADIFREILGFIDKKLK